MLFELLLGVRLIGSARHRRADFNLVGLELLRHFAHRSAEEARELAGLPHRSLREDEIAGLLFVGGMAELITAWLDGVLEASPDEIVEAASRSFLGLYG